jgi:4-amino-4-deoxy-L-arabinose transferase-like glycosyltransferase
MAPRGKRSGNRAKKRARKRTADRASASGRRSSLSSTAWVWIVLAAILILGGVTRGVYLNEIAHAPDFTNPLADARFNDYWARGLAFGDWAFPDDLDDPQLRTTPYFRAPGYPYFLGFVYGVTGPGHVGPRVVQMILGLASALLAFLLARRWFGTGIGLVLAGLMSFYWIFIYFEGEFHAPPVLIPLLLLLTILLAQWTEKATLWSGLAAGVCLGVAALLRQNVLLFLPAVAVWSVWLGRRGRRKRSLLLGFAGLVLGTIVAVMPATVRNHVVAREFVPITTGAGANLLMGNNEAATGFVAGEVPGYGKFKTAYDYPGIVARLEERLGRELTYSEASSYLTDEAVGFIRENPGKALRLTGRKVLLFWGPWEVPHSKMVQEARDASGVLARIPGNFPLVVALFAAGVLLAFWDARARRAAARAERASLEARWEVSVLVLLFVLAWFVSIVPFFVTARYRVPVIPFLLVFAAYALVRIGEFAAARDWRSAGVWVLVAVAVYVPASINFVQFEADPAKWHYDRGFAHSRAGELDRAVAEFESALLINPEHWQARADLGVTFLMQGRTDQGIAHLAEALRLNPDYAFGHHSLALAYANTGRFDESIHHLNETLRLDPGFRGAREELAMVIEARDRQRAGGVP